MKLSHRNLCTNVYVCLFDTFLWGVTLTVFVKKKIKRALLNMDKKIHIFIFLDKDKFKPSF